MLNFSSARERMVEAQVARRGVRNSRVLGAMRRVPRESFVEAGFEEFAYEDSPLPIGEEQTISQPYIAAPPSQRSLPTRLSRRVGDQPRPSAGIVNTVITSSPNMRDSSSTSWVFVQTAP
jgi:hypothetical protein